MTQRATYKYPLLDTGTKELRTTPPPTVLSNYTESDLEYLVFLNKKSKGFYIAVQGSSPSDPVSVTLNLYYVFDAYSYRTLYKKISVSATERTAVFVDTPVTPYAVWVSKESNGVTNYFTVYIE